MSSRGSIAYDQIRNGSVSVQTTNYTATETDAWKLIVFNISAGATFTLPAAPPNTLWALDVANIGTATLTIAPGGPTLDGAASSITITQFQGMAIYTDGTNYYTDRGAGGGTSILLQTNGVNNGSQSKLNLVPGTSISITDGGTGSVTIAATGSGVAGVAPSNYQLYDGTNYWVWPPAFQCVVPTGTYTWINQGASTEVASGGQLFLAQGTGAGVVGRSQAMGTKTSLTATIFPVLSGGGAAGTNPGGCIFFYESATQKMVILNAGYNNGPFQYGAWAFTNPTTFNAVIATVNIVGASVSQFPLTHSHMRARFSGSNIVLEYSVDGQANWIQLLSEAKTAHFTTAPDTWGYGAVIGGGTSLAKVALQSWVTA